MDRDIITIATQVLVNKDDRAFQKPSKPVGPFYVKEDADNIKAETGALFMEDSRYGVSFGFGIQSDLLFNTGIKIEYGYRSIGELGYVNSFGVSLLF